ncbi:type II toxin-antitoxin system PemK/MazF family toxin [Oxalobacteraceae bacterium A2-2]
MAPPAPARRFHPLPAPGDIVWCAFPQTLGEPGPKKRPALVARVSHATHEVSVVYGTSQKTHRLYPTEVALDPADSGFSSSGLSHRTKFDVAVQVQLPFDSDWFAPAPGPGVHSPLPKMGILHPSYMAAIANAVKRSQP